MIIASYSKLVVRFPGSILICGTIASFAITILTFAFVEWPDLSDPTAGFNTSGTEISDKLATFRYLQANIGPGKYFHQFPNESLVAKISETDNKTMHMVKKTRIRDRKRKNRTKFRFEGHRIFSDEFDCNSTENLCQESEITNEEPRFCRIELGDPFVIVNV